MSTFPSFLYDKVKSRGVLTYGGFFFCVFRGINEGRQCARDVDAHLTGLGSQLPVTGGIVKRGAPLEIKGFANGPPKEIVVTPAAA